ncbi:hypothetical protein P5673_013452, partial [Acropora cervicornis]
PQFWIYEKMKKLVILCLLGCFFTPGSAGTEFPQVCYGPDYGCFNHLPPFANLLMKLPQSPEEIDTTFRLYTRDNNITNEADELDDSTQQSDQEHTNQNLPVVYNLSLIQSFIFTRSGLVILNLLP